MKGQVSAEMLILLAVVVAIVALAATYLLDLGKKAGESVQEQGMDTLEDVKELSKGDPGDPCVDDEDCKGGRCNSYRCS